MQILLIFIIVLLLINIYLVYTNSSNTCDLAPSIEDIKNKDLSTDLKNLKDTLDEIKNSEIDLSSIENKLNEDIDCEVFTSWTNEDHCINGKQKQIGIKRITKYPKNNGASCPSLDNEVREINCEPTVKRYQVTNDLFNVVQKNTKSGDNITTTYQFNTSVPNNTSTIFYRKINSDLYVNDYGNDYMSLYFILDETNDDPSEIDGVLITNETSGTIYMNIVKIYYGSANVPKLILDDNDKNYISKVKIKDNRLYTASSNSEVPFHYYTNANGNKYGPYDYYYYYYHYQDRIEILNLEEVIDSDEPSVEVSEFTNVGLNNFVRKSNSSYYKLN